MDDCGDDPNDDDGDDYGGDPDDDDSNDYGDDMYMMYMMVMVMMATLVQWTWTSESLKRMLAKRSKKPPRDGDGRTHHLLQ